MTTLPVTYRGMVQPWHCDHMGHMNVMHYVGKFDEGTWNFFSMLGMPADYFRKNNRGMVAVQQNITYRRELLAGDILFVRSRLLEVREKTIRFLHEMVHGDSGEVAAFTDLTGVHTDRATRRSCPLPDDLLERLRAQIMPPLEDEIRNR